MNYAITQVETGSTWTHNRTGKARRVCSVDENSGSVVLDDPAGRRLSINAEQLLNLYFQDPAAADLFPAAEPEPDELVLQLPPTSPAYCEPFPDRRKFNGRKPIRGN